MPEQGEIKQGEEQKKETPAPNQTPSAEELQKKNKELQEKYEAEIKARDTKIADLETTRATIEARERQIKEAAESGADDVSLQTRITQINERRAYDPVGADADMAKLLKEERTKAAQEAAKVVDQQFTTKSFIENLRNGVKSANSDFDDDVVDVVMNMADTYARTGKYKTADEAVKAATDFVKLKLENYAKKKNVVPELPPGASAEGGGANQPPKAPEPPKEMSALEEIEAHNEAIHRKRL